VNKNRKKLNNNLTAKVFNANLLSSYVHTQAKYELIADTDGTGFVSERVRCQLGDKLLTGLIIVLVNLELEFEGYS